MTARASWVVPVALAVIVFVVVSWATVPYVVGVFHDDGIYALLARSIAAGDGFHHSHLPGNPAATHYPPLYPLLLGAVWSAAPGFPGNVSTLLGLNAVLIAISAVGWFAFATTWLGWSGRSAGLGALAASLATPILALSGALLSEPLFVALLWPALVLCERACSSLRSERQVVAPNELTGMHLPLLAGLAIGMLMLVRTHAIAMLVATVGVLVLHRRTRAAAIVIGTAILVQLPWIIWSRTASPPVAAPLEGAYGSYLGWFAAGLRDGGPAFVANTVRVNLAESWLLLLDRFTLVPSVAVQSSAATLVLIAGCVGAAALWRRAPVTAAFTAGYVAITLVWPYTPWRFMWAAWPVFVLLGLEGTRWVWYRAGRGRPVVAVAAALPLLAFLRTELHSFAARSWRTPARAAAAQIAPATEWVRRNTAPGDVVLAEGEQVITLYADRLAAPPIAFTAREYLVPPHGADAAARLARMIAAVPARYVVLLNPAMIAAADSLAFTGQGVRRLAQLPNGAVYEVMR